MAEIGGIIRVEEVSEILSYAELKKWYQYFCEKENAVVKQDYYFAEVCAVICNSLGGHHQISDFLLTGQKTEKIDQKDLMMGLAKMTGAKIIYAKKEGV